jgi:hypothetical protein
MTPSSDARIRLDERERSAGTAAHQLLPRAPLIGIGITEGNNEKPAVPLAMGLQRHDLGEGFATIGSCDKKVYGDHPWSWTRAASKTVSAVAAKDTTCSVSMQHAKIFSSTGQQGQGPPKQYMVSPPSDPPFSFNDLLQ